MLKSRSRKPLKSEDGMAIIEAIPVMFMLVMVLNFSLGFFGAIHSGILNSIGAYNYAFETFRYRSNLMYFRPGGAEGKHYRGSMSRVHGIVRDGTPENDNDTDKWPATMRSITFNYSKSDSSKNLSGATESDRAYRNRDQGNNIWHVTSLFEPEQGSAPIQTPRIWIKTVYGICVTAVCTSDQDKNATNGDGPDRTGE